MLNAALRQQAGSHSINACYLGFCLAWRQELMLPNSRRLLLMFNRTSRFEFSSIKTDLFGHTPRLFVASSSWRRKQLDRLRKKVDRGIHRSCTRIVVRHRCRRYITAGYNPLQFKTSRKRVYCIPNLDSISPQYWPAAGRVLIAWCSNNKTETAGHPENCS